MFARIFTFTFGIAAYAAFFATLLMFMGWMLGIGLGVVMPLDAPATAPLGQALLVDLMLVALFGLQHSVMARPAFKAWWTRYLPQPLERSVYVLASSLALYVLMAFWQPLGGVVWSADSMAGQVAFYAGHALGWVVLFLATFLINHFDLFGLRQVWLYFQGKKYEQIKFRLPLFYRYARHPLYFGFLIAFWAAPTMTVTHLLFALLTTGYILTAIQLEERDLVVQYGDAYRNYKKWAPMLIPFTKGKMPEQADTVPAEEKETPAPLY